MSTRLRQIDWRMESDFLPQLCVGTFLRVMNRSIKTPRFPAVSYSLNSEITSTFLRQNIPGYDSDGDKLVFARNVNMSGLCFCIGGRLIVHNSISEIVSSIMKVRLAPATCVGEINVDLLDEEVSDWLTNHLDSDCPLDQVISLLGRPVHQDYWMEVIPKRPDRSSQFQDDAIQFSFTEHARNVTADKGTYIVKMDIVPFRLAEVHEYGLLSGEVMLARPDVYDFLNPMLPQPFWWKSLWAVK